MLELLEDYDCLVWGNTTFNNVVSWGENYLNNLKNTLIIVFSNHHKKAKFKNVIYCSSFEDFNKKCKKLNLEKIFVSGGATINDLFFRSNLVDNIIINYNPYVLSQGINLFQGEYFEKQLKLDKIVKEKEDIVQIWYNVIN